MKRILSVAIILTLSLALIPAAFAESGAKLDPDTSYTAVQNDDGTISIYDDRYDHVPPVMTLDPNCKVEDSNGCDTCGNKTPAKKPSTCKTSCKPTRTLCYKNYCQKISANNVGEYRQKVTKALRLALEVRNTGWVLIKEDHVQSKSSGSHSTLHLRHTATGQEVELVEWAYTHSNSSCRPQNRTYYVVYVWEYFAKTKIANLPCDDFITPAELDYGDAIDALIEYLEYVVEDGSI